MSTFYEGIFIALVLSHHRYQYLLDFYDSKFKSRFVNDICIDNSDDYLAMTDHAYTPMDCKVNLFEIGRRKPNEADSDMDDAQDDSESEDPEEGFEEEEANMSSNMRAVMAGEQGPQWQQNMINGMMNDVMDFESLLYNSGSDEYDDDASDYDDDDYGVNGDK